MEESKKVKIILKLHGDEKSIEVNDAIEWIVYNSIIQLIKLKEKQPERFIELAPTVCEMIQLYA